MAKVFGYSRSSFYHYKNYEKKSTNRKVLIVKKILNIYNKSHGTYGSPRLTIALREEGIMITKRTVQKYMNELMIKSITYKKFKYKRTTFRNEYKFLHNYLKETNVDRLNKVWTQDVTYVKLKDGTNAYLASVMDLYSRKIISYELSKTMTSDLIVKVLRNAYKIRKPKDGLILHSDKGAQYRSEKYISFAKYHRAIRSYTRIVFSCADNACQESFHASFKKECLYHLKPQNFEDTKMLVFRYIDGFYNIYRIHSSIGYRSPARFEEEIIKGKASLPKPLLIAAQA